MGAEQAEVEVVDGEFVDDDAEIEPSRVVVVVRNGDAEIWTNDRDVETLVVDLDRIRTFKESEVPFDADEFFDAFDGLEDLVMTALASCIACDETAVSELFCEKCGRNEK